MRPILFGALTLALGFATPTFAGPGIVSRDASAVAAGRWRLDPSHSSLTVKLSHLGFSMFTLRFDRMQASFTYDPAHPAQATVSADVEPGSVNTGQPALDRELAGEAWFDAVHGKTIGFVSHAIDVGDGHHGKMTGDLTMRGITKPVTLDVTFNGTGIGFGPPVPRVGFSATGIVRKTDFGMTKFAGVLGDDVQIAIEAEFTRDANPGAAK